MKWMLMIVGLVLVGGGFGYWRAGSLTDFAEDLGLIDLEDRIERQLETLRADADAVDGKMFDLLAKAESEQIRRGRMQEERMRVDSACRTLAQAINATSTGPAMEPVGPKARGSKPTPVALLDAGQVQVAGPGRAPGMVRWADRFVPRKKAVGTLTQWGRRVIELDDAIETSERMDEIYRTAAARLKKERTSYTKVIAELEQRLSSLLADQKVLEVRDQVGELLAGVQGEGGQGKTAKLLRRLQNETDQLEGRIRAHGLLREDPLPLDGGEVTGSGDAAVLETYGVSLSR